MEALNQRCFAASCTGALAAVSGSLSEDFCSSSCRKLSLSPVLKNKAPIHKKRRSCGTVCVLAEPGARTSSSPLDEFAKQIKAVEDARGRAQLLLQYALQLQRLDPFEKNQDNLVMGCTAQVWVTAKIGDEGNIYFRGDSDSELSRGLLAVLINSLSGLRPEEVLAVQPEDLTGLGLGPALQARSRINGFQNILQYMQRRARALLRLQQGFALQADSFPSLLIRPDGQFEAQGEFARSQAQYLNPSPTAVGELVSLLASEQIGVVAHFYMDPQVQGVLAAASRQWPHIHISDSLVMADRAAAMADAGCKHIAVLGVDFMAENVRAILDRAGHTDVSVVRMADEAIGCSLAEAAEGAGYKAYLENAAATPSSLHVIYINTSLLTKAEAQSLLPTITCTSSNVVQTVLQAFAQVPEATVWYGPDTFMGGNLVELLDNMRMLSNEEIAAIHPAHSRQTITALLPRLHYFQEGTCIVHDLFGKDVVSRVRELYGDAYITAHFEVPGDMFALAMEARQRGMGVVGSTSNILDFIGARVREAIERGFAQRLRFVLGTEVGMVTSIVGLVSGLLSKAGEEGGERPPIEVEIVFPVSSDAVAQTKGADGERLGLTVVPGVSSGEGCSISGGCASCPYMKMNSLDALMRVCRWLGTPGESLLEPYKPNTWKEPVGGLPIAELGTTSILHMRHFQTRGEFSSELVRAIRSGVSRDGPKEPVGVQ